MSSVNGQKPRAGQRYWRSLDEFAQTPEFKEFMHREFPAGAADLIDGDDRRHFLKIMGASLALAGLSLGGCRRWPEEEIAPYASRPEGRIPGKAVQYATCSDLSGVASSLLVASYDNRPVKIDGNPDDTNSMGASSVFNQAAILDMYDPDRSREVLHNNEASTMAAFDGWLNELRSASSDGAGVAILTEANSSPTMARLRRAVAAAMPRASWHEYESVQNDNVVAGSRLAFGTAMRQHIDYSAADIIVSLDSDFMGADPNAIANARTWAIGRRPGSDAAKASISRMYCFEAGLSITGGAADERAAVRRTDIALIARAIAASLNTSVSAPDLSGLSEKAQHAVDHAIADLASNRGNSVVTVGAGQPAEVHYLCHLINQLLGNVGRVVQYTADDQVIEHVASIQALTDALNGGSVNTVLMIGGNPVYNAPANLKFAEALAKAQASAHLSDYVNETSKVCTWHVHRAHTLECWGDGRTWNGSYVTQQPLIEPLFGGRSPIEFLGALLGDSTSGRDMVRATYAEAFGGGASETTWRKTLHDGIKADSAATPASATARDAALSAVLAALDKRVDDGGVEVSIVSDSCVYDGRFANNGWLQELPDPFTKITWDNAAIIGVNRATTMGVKTGDFIVVSHGDASITIPAFVLPGQHDDVVTISLGYGRSMDGARICNDAGFDVASLRNTDAMDFASGASISKASGSYVLATTQDHHTIDVNTVGGRGVQERLGSLYREGEITTFRKDPSFVKHAIHVPHRLSLWEENLTHHSETGTEGAKYKWGMSIDLNTCIGCSACVVACQAENNIPVVGKDQVKRGREMHWLRMDRYFTFGEDGHDYDPSNLKSVAMQPVACQHCENAACEQVCPVAATVHDADGLNVMVYNRCIGTRYCSNNCPYKVRRFNYFDYHRRKPHREQPGALMQVEGGYYTRPQGDAGVLERMGKNPEVTIRVRGVMEKCSYCLQRLNQAKIDAKNAWVKANEADRGERPIVPDGTLQTACQQACATKAIEFGDLLDTNSRVAKAHDDPRAYELLEEINPKPRTRYLARLVNPAEPGSRISTDAGHDNNHGGGH